MKTLLTRLTILALAFACFGAFACDPNAATADGVPIVTGSAAGEVPIITATSTDDAEIIEVGKRGMVRTGKRGIYDGFASGFTKRGGEFEGRYTQVGKGVPRGAGAALARDFGIQELIHGPRDDRSIIERGMDRYDPNDNAPYSGKRRARRMSYSEPGDNADYGLCSGY